MKIISSDYVLTCSEDFKILENCAVCFDETILSVDKLGVLIKKYPQAEVIKLPKNSLVMPGLVNPHVHLEFSSNRSSLKYGSFIPWLDSVIKKRDKLLLACSDEVIKKQLNIMLKSGTTSLGAISSFGNDFEACLKTPQRVVFFIEILGSRPDSIDTLFDDFKSRLRQTQESQSDRLAPAISIHSAYSTHPILAKNALDIARKHDYTVSTHFMESKAEREWLDCGKGEFCEFFDSFSPNSRPMSSSHSFLELFIGSRALFTHCVQATDKELKYIEKIGGVITHSPVSNRLLGVGKLDISKLENFTLGTDGLSSNISLNLWDEMRAVLWSHQDEEINELAKKVIKAVTINGAKALGLNCGEIKKGRCADLIVCELSGDLQSIEDIMLQLILHTKFTKATFVAGERV